MILKYIITGMPRSGTQFMAHLFRNAEIPCGHEMFFGFPGMGEYVENAQADSSWLAGGVLEEWKEKGVKILHITRNPIKVINSLFTRNFFEREGINRGTLFMIYPYIFFPEIMNKKAFDKYILFYIKWNEEIEKYADARVKIEDVNEDLTLPFKKLDIPSIGTGIKRPEKANQGSKKQVITNDILKNSQLYPQLVQKAKEYGYNEKDLNA